MKESAQGRSSSFDRLPRNLRFLRHGERSIDPPIFPPCQGGIEGGDLVEDGAPIFPRTRGAA